MGEIQLDACSNFMKSMVILILMVTISPIVIAPLSTPIPNDVVVVMSDDDSVMKSVETIKANIENLMIVTYGSLEYTLSIHRVTGQVVWVSHGSDEGIAANHETIAWQQFARDVQATPRKDIIIACYSANINNFVSEQEAIGIDGLVDAQLGGLIAACLLAPSLGIIEKAITHMNDLLSGSVEPRVLAPFEVTLRLWWDWLIPHGTIDVRYNLLAIFGFVMIAFCCWVGGSIWDAVGVILDIFDVTFGNVLLDWIWPVLVKPALQVILCAAFGVMSSVIAIATSTIRALAGMMIIQAAVAMLSYAISTILVAFVQSVGVGWLANPINVVLIKKIEDAINGPIARNIARYVNLGDSFTAAASKIGFGLLGGVIIAGVESVLEWFFYTYASSLSYEWSAGF